VELNRPHDSPSVACSRTLLGGVLNLATFMLLKLTSLNARGVHTRVWSITVFEELCNSNWSSAFCRNVIFHEYLCADWGTVSRFGLEIVLTVVQVEGS